MPARQPFTRICQAAARHAAADRADLHIHTVHSDGRYTPAQVVDLAGRCGLAAIAITDHDTLSGVAEARDAAAHSNVEVISGVEISACFREREIHVLGYFVNEHDESLARALTQLRDARAKRFHQMIDNLRAAGVTLPATPTPAAGRSLGRRYLAELLVGAGRVGSVHDAFRRYLGDNGPATVPKDLLPAEQALALIRGAGGVASWAHPSYDCSCESLPQLRDWGLSALEAVYPGRKGSRAHELREQAAQHGLVVTGGSDCHGPDPRERGVGAVTITRAELELLRARSRR
jgi:3',5'-nucleoside bisphosphate phosphatase